MKLLKVSAKKFKNLANDVEIDFVAKARKTSEDKEYELHEIDENLFVYSTMAFVGKNASGKTTAIDLLAVAYDILSFYRVEEDYSLNNAVITIFFYHEGYIYKYITKLCQEELEKNKVTFSDEYLGKKKYYSSYFNKIYYDNFEEILLDKRLPDDISSVFFVFDKRAIGALKYSDSEFNPYVSSPSVYETAFLYMKFFEIDKNILNKILRMFDDNITDLEADELGNYTLKYNGEDKYLTPKELFCLLSSGTTKGILLYIMIVASLKHGVDIIIDEIENHFHKTLVENVITLYKDKTVNKKNATLIFSTHYCELLDLFNRQDNIYVANSDKKVILNSIYDKYGIRNDLLKSKAFYSGEFKTSVNYELLMDLKKELK